MSLRLVEAIIPAAYTEEVPRVLEDLTVLGVWATLGNEHFAVVRILTATGNTEAISDALSERFDHFADFRVMLFSVEATVPMPEESTTNTNNEQADSEADEQEQSKARAARISREELYQDIAQGAQFSTVYLVTVVLSTVVAAVGLLRDNVAVIIGAMVIAPLLGPNVALALASTLGDLKLAGRSVKTLLAGIATAAVLSVGIGIIATVDPHGPEIFARTQVTMGDIVLALAAGSAGALAFTTGIPAAVIGVMVAVALLPPLVVVGLLIGAGYASLAGGALMLFLSNVACVNLAGVVTFLAQKIRPRAWWEAEYAERASRIALSLWVAAVTLLLAAILLMQTI
jgi:uncharacterized hydrophobic protein (TIGR00341 family)